MRNVPDAVQLSLRNGQLVHQTVHGVSLAKAGARDSGSAGMEAHIGACRGA